MEARDSPAIQEKYVAAMNKRRNPEQGGESPPKLRRVRRLDSIRLDRKDATYFTDEGYLVDHPILTSCGIFEYRNPDGSVRRELRLPEHVFEAESLKSYRGKPVIITHEAGVVDKDNVDREQIGAILTDGYRDGDNVRAEVIIHNTDAMRDCGLRELSLGYNLDLLEEPGEWNGQPYDAIQTNIRINHLALVADARAGDKARLNIDGSDEPEELKGGKKAMDDNVKKEDSALTPEQMEEAIALWKEKNAKGGADGDDAASASTDNKDGETPDAKSGEKNGDDKSPDKAAVPDDTPGSSVADKLAFVKDRRDRRDADGEPGSLKDAKSVIAQQDEDLDALTACLEMLLAKSAESEKDGSDAGNADCGGKGCKGSAKDSSDDKSQSMNADSADEMIRQRLSICRIGDKLNLDGLENLSIMDGKKAIIAKVLPTLRLDGASKSYVDASYDLAVGEVNKRKDADYQRKQMTGGRSPESRNDGNEGMSMAASARLRMLEREGGNQ